MPRHGRHDLQGALKGGQGGEGGGGAEPALRAGTSRAVGLQLQSGRYVPELGCFPRFQLGPQQIMGTVGGRGVACTIGREGCFVSMGRLYYHWRPV